MDAAHHLAPRGAIVRTMTENSYGRVVDEVLLSVATKSRSDIRCR